MELVVRPGIGAILAPILIAPANGSIVSSSVVTFQWNAVIGAVQYYLVIWSSLTGAQVYSGWVGNITSVPLTGLPGSGSLLQWQVYGLDGSNWSMGPGSAIWSFTYTYIAPPIPAVPSNLVATAMSTSQINLSWQRNSTDESGFKIERKTGAGGTYSQIATVGAGVVSYSNSGLSAVTTYYYRVRAYNASGDSSYSNEASATSWSPWANGTTHSASIVVKNPSSHSWTYQVKFYIKSGTTTKFSIENWSSFTLAPGTTKALNTGSIVTNWGVGSYTVELTVTEITTSTNLGVFTNTAWNFNLT